MHALLLLGGIKVWGMSFCNPLILLLLTLLLPLPLLLLLLWVEGVCELLQALEQLGVIPSSSTHQSAHLIHLKTMTEHIRIRCIIMTLPFYDVG